MSSRVSFAHWFLGIVVLGFAATSVWSHPIQLVAPEVYDNAATIEEGQSFVAETTQFFGVRLMVDPARPLQGPASLAIYHANNLFVPLAEEQFLAPGNSVSGIVTARFSQPIQVVPGDGYVFTIKTSGEQVWGIGLNRQYVSVYPYGNQVARSNPSLPFPSRVDGRDLSFEIISGPKLEVGGRHTLYLLPNGDLWTVGKNEFGQLGDGTTTNRPIPVLVATNVMAVAAGENHSLVLKEDGSVWGVGRNHQGQLGLGDTTNRTSLTLVVTNFLGIAASDDVSFFVRQDGKAYGMGYNAYGRLGDGTTIERAVLCSRKIKDPDPNHPLKVAKNQKTS